MKTKTYVKLLRLLISCFFLTNTHSLFAQSTGVVTGVPTFQSIGLYWSGSGGNANTVCNVKYRIAGSTPWVDGFPLWFDSRAHNAGDVPGYTGVVLPANQYRGSIVGLNAGTNYEVQLTAGASTATTTITTWAETSAWPVSNLTTVTNSSSQLNITTSGTVSGYRLYTGNATIDVANAAVNCIYINAAYIIIRGLTLKGASEDAIRLGPQAHDVVIENCDISGWGATSYPTPYNSFPNTHSAVRIRGKAANDAGSTENCYNVTRIVVQRNKMHDPRGSAGSWDGGYPYGPQGVCFQEAGGNMVIRYNDIYGSDAKHFQDGIGGLNNFTKSGFPRDNSDIYGNKISYCWDDGIESEGSDCNVRIYANFIDNIFTGVATATNSVGPLYIYRNVTYVGRRHAIGTSNSNLDIEDRGPFNKCGTQNSAAIAGRTFLFHNTVLQPTQTGFANPRGLDGGTMDNGGGPVQNTFSRNNIWTAAYQGQGGRSIAENNTGSGVGCTYQYDVCNTANILKAGVATNIMSGNPAYAAGVPVAPLAINGGPRTQGYDLATNSIGYNAGTVLANFNDGFIGTAPDAGAYEAGKPPLEFGVNAYLPPSGNQPPVANAGNDTTITLPANSVTLTGSGTDANGTITGYAWTRVSGPTTFTLGTANAATTTLTNLVQGIYVFRLTVTDNGGATATDDVTVTVNAAVNLPPTANAGSDITLTLPTNSTTLLGSGTDADGTIAAYAWARVSGPTTFTLGTANTATTTLTNLVQGTYVFRLTVTDNGGATGTDDVTVIVNATSNIVPTANAGSDVTLTLPVNSTTLLGSGTDADGTIAAYAWTRVSGPTTFTLGTANTATTTLTNLVQGTYVFRLTVTDNGGATGTDNVTVIVNAAPNIAPTANAGSDVTLTLPVNSTTLLGSGTDADGTIAGYAWTRVSGPTTFTLGTANAATTTLTNLVQGTYVFRLTVTDNSGATATDNVTVVVNAAINQPPAANAGNNIILTLPVNSTILNGSGIDPDGTIASYAWSRVSGPTTFTLVNANTASSGLNSLVQGIYIFRLTVTDNNGATGTDDVTVTVNAAANQPPTANAGNNIVITLPTNSTALVGNGTDADGTITSYAWSRLSGPATFTLVNANTALSGLNDLVQGTYVFRLTVTDNNGATGTDDVTVTVNASAPSNQAPIAISGNTIIVNLPANTTNLNGTNSFDPDGTIVSYAWTRVSGPATYTLANANASTTTLSNLVAGTYVFQLTVTDNNGATDDDNITIIVNTVINQPPVANAGNNIVLTLPQNSTNLNGGNSIDPDGTISNYAWTRVSGPATFALGNANAAATVLSNLVQGTYVFRLTVTDNNGAIAVDDVTVTVNAAANQAPTANAGSDITLILPLNSSMLTGSGYDPDGTITNYAWTRLSGPATFTLGTANAATTMVTNLIQGTYVFRLTITDNNGATATDNVTVTVNAALPPINQAPTANAGSDITLLLPINFTVLTGSGYDPDGTIAGYAWTKVSGPATFTLGTANAATTSLSNLVQGTYVFRLTITDNNGATATDVVTVTVNPSTNQSPTANAGADISITLPVNTTTLHGSGSDPDGTIVSYAWSRVSGPTAFTLANISSATTGLYNLVQGIYVFRLTVTDNQGATATDNIMVTVNAAPPPPANQPPVARTDNDIVITLPVSSTLLHGNMSSDPDGVIVAYAWTQLSGPSQAVIGNRFTAIATASSLKAGIYTFELKVTDDDGASSTKTMKVTVKNKRANNASLKVFPNPASGVLNMQYEENTTGKLRVSIYDANRKLIRDEVIDKTQVFVIKTIDLSLFKSGVYFIQITSPDNEKTVTQFVKM